MTRGLDKERQTAALELMGAMQGLILTNTVPDYMVDFLQSRIDAVRRSYGIEDKPRKVRAKEAANAQA